MSSKDWPLSVALVPLDWPLSVALVPFCKGGQWPTVIK